MCQKCIDANAKLEQFLTELQEEFKGETVQGIPVNDDHHIAVALVGALESRKSGRELLDIVAQRRVEEAFLSELQNQLKAPQEPAFLPISHTRKQDRGN